MEYDPEIIIACNNTFYALNNQDSLHPEIIQAVVGGFFGIIGTLIRERKEEWLLKREPKVIS